MKRTTFRATIARLLVRVLLLAAAEERGRTTNASSSTPREIKDSSHGATYCMRGRIAPILFILGPAKTATTSLARDLRDTFSNLYLGHSLSAYHEPSWFWKEKHYFGGGFVDYYPDIERYLAHYPACAVASDVRDVGADCTPQLASRSAAQRISRTYGPEGIKRLHFVVTMRERIHRVASEFKFMMRHWRFTDSRRFLLWKDFDRHVEKHPEAFGWEDWMVHHDTRRRHMNVSIDANMEGERLDAWLQNAFHDWIRAQLALAESCHVRDRVPLHRLWPECGERGIFQSLYGPQLLHWFQYFSPKQFVVVPMASYTDSPGRILSALAQRLGLACAKKKFAAASRSAFRLVAPDPSALLPSLNAMNGESVDGSIAKERVDNLRPCNLAKMQASRVNAAGPHMGWSGATDDSGAILALRRFYDIYEDALRELLIYVSSGQNVTDSLELLIVANASQVEDPTAFRRPRSIVEDLVKDEVDRESKDLVSTFVESIRAKALVWKSLD